jgi:hypothetical protein
MEEEVIENEQPIEDSSLEDRIAEKMFGSSEEPEEVTEEEQPESEAVEQPAEPELVEVDFSGKQYKLPPELKDALMAQSDYTRKTQEIAEQRRMLDQQVMLQQQEAQFNQAVAPEIDHLKQLDLQLAQYKKLDWNQMDFETMTRTRLEMDRVKDAREEINSSIQNKKGQFEQYRKKMISEATQKGNEYLKKHIQNWGPDVAQDLTQYGIKEGYSDVELGSLTDPRIIKTLWKARQWDQLQSQKGTVKRAEKVAPVIKPGASNKAQVQNDDASYRKALRSAKTSSDKARIIQERIEKTWA